MRIVKVSVNYGETINIGNYESRRIDYGATAELAPGEEPAAAQRELLLLLRNEVKEAADRVIAADRH